MVQGTVAEVAEAEAVATDAVDMVVMVEEVSGSNWNKQPTIGQSKKRILVGIVSVSNFIIVLFMHNINSSLKYQMYF